ncbi:hypothetical protein B5M09_006608 [Aphanomyces astaci]|uniref:Uncharacterized protein n=1 Tax=Aphanomyces astaci TaxID=112090 RepID=A0A425D893_APHAT|nr:hypothetical protein B5M09_006608 [Aphanomyces astaci]
MPFPSLDSIERQLQLVQSHIFANELDQALAVVAALPPAVADTADAVAVLGKFTDLPQLSPTNKLLADVALAEAFAFFSMAQVLAHRSHAGIAASLRRCHQLYSQIHSTLATTSSSLDENAVPPLVRQDVVGRAQLGVGAFAMCTGGVVPTEYHWILQLWQQNSLEDGVRLVHTSWLSETSRSHWAGLMLMNATPMLLQHWVAGHKAKRQQANNLHTPTTTTTLPPTSVANMSAYDRHHVATPEDSDEPSTDDSSSKDDSPANHSVSHGFLLQSSCLLRVAAGCLEAHPHWAPFLWSRSVHIQHTNPVDALALAQEAATSCKGTYPYMLQVHIGRLQFKLHRMDDAADTFQQVLAMSVKTPAAAAPIDVHQTTCAYLAGALCCESHVNLRFVRSLLAQTSYECDKSLSRSQRYVFCSRLCSSKASVDMLLLVHRARYYHALASDVHVRLLTYDLLYMCFSDNSHIHRHRKQDALHHDDDSSGQHEVALANLDGLMASQFPHTDGVLPPWLARLSSSEESSSCFPYIVGDNPVTMQFALDWLTLRGLVLLYLDVAAAKLHFKRVLALTTVAGASRSFGVPVASFHLARELAPDDPGAAIALLDHAGQWGKTSNASDAVGYTTRLNVLRSLLQQQPPQPT